MGAPRRFDHDEARRRYKAGESGIALAREFGVSPTSIYRIVDPECGARMDQKSKAWIRAKREPCIGGCGRLVWRHERGATGYCPTCHGQMRTKSVRTTTLRCCTCKKWKPDEAFPQRASETHRRGRSYECRKCQTISRRERRQANLEATRAYDREYKRRKREQAA